MAKISGEKLVKDSLEYLLFGEVYQRFSEPKARRKAMGLLEAAIQCLARKGFDGLTLEMISREAGVSRPLIKHYFATLDEIRFMAAKYIRLLFQRRVIAKVLTEKTPEGMLGAYVQGCFDWVEEQPTHARVWLAFLHRCSRFKEERALNTTAADIGHERIAALLQAGANAGQFRCTDCVGVAKSIQTLVMGAMITWAVEDQKDPLAYVDSTKNHVFHLAQLVKVTGGQ